jgi:hypothetical protein
MMVGEYGTVEDAPGDKAAWVTAAHEALKGKLAGIDAVVYFHSVRDRDGLVYDWRMDTSDSALQAFKDMGADSWFNPEVKTTLPDTVIDDGPEGAIASREATFSFSASEAGGGFQCRVDVGAFESCQSPRKVSGLTDGPHAFEVRALTADGHPDPTPARREWSIDTVAPTVESVKPADGEAAAPPDTPVSATFSEDLDAATVTATSFTLVAEATGRPVSAKAVYDPASHTASLHPDQALLPLTAYRATVAGDVTDRVGNEMGQDHTWHFTTALAGGGEGSPAPPGNPPAPPAPAPPVPAPPVPAPAPAPPAPPGQPGQPGPPGDMPAPAPPGPPGGLPALPGPGQPSPPPKR